MLFKNSVRTSKRTPHFTITKNNSLMLFKEVIAVYSENHAKPINTKCSITDCQRRWFIYLPLSLKELNEVTLHHHAERVNSKLRAETCKTEARSVCTRLDLSEVCCKTQTVRILRSCSTADTLCILGHVPLSHRLGSRLEFTHLPSDKSTRT